MYLNTEMYTLRKNIFFFFRKNYMEVRVFFEEMSVQIVEQKPQYEAGDLLGNC